MEPNHNSTQIPVKLKISIKTFESLNDLDKLMVKLEEIKRANPTLMFDINVEADLRC